jgi:uncharacterized Fe-S cluster protein YjdI
MAYDIPTRFHQVWSRHRREIERTKMCGRIIIIVKKKHRIANTSSDCVRGDVIIVKKKRRIAIHHSTAFGVT